MATSGKAFGISIAIYSAICIAIFILFSWWRQRNLTRKFYAPKRFVKYPGHQKPPRLRSKWGAWAVQVFKMSEAEVIRCGGMDAAMYVKILEMGMKLFFFVSIIVLVIILPINITGTEVDKLMELGSTPEATSEFTYWLNSPSPSPSPEQSSSGQQTTDTTTTAAPEFYNTDIPPAPPGLVWWEYLPGVPDLPDPEVLLGANYSRYGWRYDSDFTSVSYSFTNLDKTTMANISDRSPRLWAHAVVVWMVTFFTFYVLWSYSKEALRLRTFYLLNQPPGAESHTVLVTDIPGVLFGTIPQRLDGTLLKFVPKGMKETAFKHVHDIKEAVGSQVAKHADVPIGKRVASKADLAAASKMSNFATEINPETGRWEMPDPWRQAADQLRDGKTVSEIVENEFRAVHRDDFRVAHMVYNTSELDPLVAEYEKRARVLEDLLDDYISKKRRSAKLKIKKMTVVGPTMGAWGREKYGLKPVKVEALQFLHDRLEQLKVEIEEQQVKARGKLFPSAFVTFNARLAQVGAVRSLMNEDLSTWRCQAAPRPSEIVWGNLGWRIWERAGRHLLMLAAFIALAFFFMIPVAAVQGLLTTNSLVGALQRIAILNAVLTSILPGLALKIFIALVPAIIMAMNRFAGMVSLSQMDLALTSRFFVFQVITVFFGSFIAGSFFNQFKQFIDDPGSIVTVLGTSAPQTAIFFMTYLLVQALLTQPLGIVRVVSLVIFWVKSKLAATARAKRRLWEDQEFRYGTVLPNDTIAILLGLTFSTICPLILPIAFLYFVAAYLVHKYSLVYVYKQPYQTGGKFWQSAFDQCIVGLVIFQLVMIGLLGIKKVIGPPIFIVPLPFLTLSLYFAAHARFWRPFEGLSLLSAGLLDKREKDAWENGTLQPPADKEIEERYLSPSFKFDTSNHEHLVGDALRMKAVLDGGSDDKLLGLEDTTDDEDDGSVTPASETPVDIESGSGASAPSQAPPRNVDLQEPKEVIAQ
ncbi:hypothetical protein ACKKBG_A06245 [Auxenochlorella protothecoides x Auxenochlorella symbiontica]